MKLFQKGELKLLWPFYVEMLISHILYFAPAFWILQFQQNFSLSQIGLLLSVVSIVIFIFEIPTGAIADIYGRKVSTLIGYFSLSIVIFSISFVTSFYGLFCLFILWGIAGTFISGAKESWIIDKLKANKKSSLVREFYLREHSIIKISLFLSGLVGAFIVSRLGLNSIWAFGGLSFFVSAILLSFIGEERVTSEKKQSFGLVFLQARKSIKYAIKHHTLSILLWATFFIMMRDAFGGDLVWQPFLRSLGMPLYFFGFLFSIATLIGSITPFFSKWILSKFRSERNYLAFFLLCCIFLDLSVYLVHNVIFGVIVLLAMYLVIDLSMPIGANYFQGFVPSRMRATITSFNSMVVSAGYAVSYTLSGFFAETIGPQYTIVLGAIFLVPALILYMRIKDKK